MVPGIRHHQGRGERIGKGEKQERAEQEAAKDAMKKFEILSTKSETNPNVRNPNDPNE